MAKTTTTKDKKTTQLNTWDQKLAEEARIAAGSESNVSAGKFISTDGGLFFNEQQLPGNEMAVIILDSVHENVYYDTPFSKGTTNSPACFAFSHNHTDERLPMFEPMCPHADAPRPQADACIGCPHNEFGSAKVGAGKACRNVRRLAVIGAGQFTRDGSFDAITDPKHYEETEVAYLKLPVTSTKGFALWVKQQASTLQRPPHGLFARIRWVEDDDNQFRIEFEALAKVPDKLMQVVMKRREDQVEKTAFPYVAREVQAPVKGGKQKPAAGGKKPANKRAYSR